jgi:hypothetical protein
MKRLESCNLVGGLFNACLTLCPWQMTYGIITGESAVGKSRWATKLPKDMNTISTKQLDRQDDLNLASPIILIFSGCSIATNNWLIICGTFSFLSILFNYSLVMRFVKDHFDEYRESTIGGMLHA